MVPQLEGGSVGSSPVANGVSGCTFFSSSGFFARVRFCKAFAVESAPLGTSSLPNDFRFGDFSSGSSPFLFLFPSPSSVRKN